jgi:hypothetical protein
MIHYELMRDQSILVITPDGPLQKADFEQLAKEVDPFINSNGNLAGLMIARSRSPAGTASERWWRTSSSSPIIIDGLNALLP